MCASHLDGHANLLQHYDQAGQTHCVTLESLRHVPSPGTPAVLRTSVGYSAIMRSGWSGFGMCPFAVRCSRVTRFGL